MNGVGLFEHASGFIADSDKIPNPASLYRQQLEERLTYGIPPDMPLELSADTDTHNQITLHWTHYALSPTPASLKELQEIQINLQRSAEPTAQTTGLKTEM